MISRHLYDMLTYSNGMPKIFGPLHCSMIILTLLATALVAKIFGNAKEKNVRIFLFFVWLLIFIMQVYRQVAHSLVLIDDVPAFDYKFEHLPLQVCSVQLYVLPFIVFLKEGRLRDSFIAIMCLWSFIGGLGVTIYPGTTLHPILGLSLQSMIHHGIQVILGVLLTIRYCHRINIRYFLGGFSLFMVYFAIAMTANVKIHEFIVATGRNDGINMFFLSPYHDSDMPILQTIRDLTSYPIMVLTYLLAFTLLAFVLYKIQCKLTNNRQKNLLKVKLDKL